MLAGGLRIAKRGLNWKKPSDARASKNRLQVRAARAEVVVFDVVVFRLVVDDVLFKGGPIKQQPIQQEK